MTHRCRISGSGKRVRPLLHQRTCGHLWCEHREGAFVVAVIILYALLAVAVLYWIPVRLWYRRWGVTDAELNHPMAGDKEVSNPNYLAMLAVTIDAPSEYVWPWLLQMGKGRGGLYSYDFLDRLFGYLDRPSADRILPEFQHLAVGDVIPVGGAAGGFPVKTVKPGEALVLGGETETFQWIWQLALVPVSRSQTRLISRNQARVPRSIASFLFMLALEPAAFIMTRKMLLGIKRRAEALCRESGRGSALLLPSVRV
jgi:hypothetical protein